MWHNLFARNSKLNLNYGGLTHQSYTCTVRCTVVEGSGLILTIWRSLLSTEILTPGVFAFCLRLKNSHYSRDGTWIFRLSHTITKFFKLLHREKTEEDFSYLLIPKVAKLSKYFLSQKIFQASLWSLITLHCFGLPHNKALAGSPADICRFFKRWTIRAIKKLPTCF